MRAFLRSSLTLFTVPIPHFISPLPFFLHCFISPSQPFTVLFFHTFFFASVQPSHVHAAFRILNLSFFLYWISFYLPSWSLPLLLPLYSTLPIIPSLRPIIWLSLHPPVRTSIDPSIHPKPEDFDHTFFSYFWLLFSIYQQENQKLSFTTGKPSLNETTRLICKSNGLLPPRTA